MSKKNTIIKVFLFTLLLAFSVAIPAFAQDDESEGQPPVIPEEERISFSDDFQVVVLPKQSTVIYDGKSHSLDPLVLYKDEILKKQTDYEVSFHNNVYPGTCTVEVRGIGRFTGTAYTRYEIMPATCKDFRDTKRTTNSVSLRWDAAYCDGYKVYKYNYSTGKWEMKKKLKGKANREYTLTNLTPGTTAKVMVKAYVEHKGETITGKASPVMQVPVKPAKGKITSVTDKGNSLVVVKWPKQRCSGYEIELSRSKSFWSRQNYIINAEDQVQKTIAVLNQYFNDKGYGKRYVRMRAFKDGSTGNFRLRSFGAWSDVVTVNVKK